MSADTINKAFSAFLDNDFDTATTLLKDEAAKNKTAEILDKLAAVQLRTGESIDALRNAEEAVKLDPTFPQAHYRKATAHFDLKQFEEAMNSYKEAVKVNKENTSKSGKSVLSQRIVDTCKKQARKCEAELEDEEPDSDEEEDGEAAPEVRNQNRMNELNAALGSRLPETDDFPVNIGGTYKFKHEYYQTADYVIILVKAKHQDPENVKVTFNTTHMNVTITTDTGGEEYNRTFALFSRIDPDNCTYKVLGTKIEIKVSKDTNVHWTELEKPLLKGERDKLKSAYSSKKNWSQIEKMIDQEEALEKPEGDEAMNKLFADIYKNANPDVRRAMNKSFSESGGTVLSTNWDEVNKADYQTERTAPDGMEWRTWEGDKIPTKDNNKKKERD